jgi:hypothetical protein
VEPPRLAAQLLLPTLDRVAQRAGLVGLERREREPLGEALPRLAARAIADGGLREAAEVVVRAAAPG